MLTRRDLLARAGAVLAHPRSVLQPLAMAATTVPWRQAVAAPAEVVLEAAPATLQLADDGGPPLPVWSYNARSPGPILRYRVGDTARLRVRNQLTQPTTVHWHGMRVPFAMDGVPGLSQQPIAPGAEFLYEFPVRNPGTYWYHPHFQSAEQLDCVAAPRSRHLVRDTAYPRRPFELLHINYSDEAAIRREPLPPVAALPPPGFTEPDLARAMRHPLILEGGAMGGMREGTLRGQRLSIRELARRGKVWALNGVVAADLQVEPWLSAQLGSTHVLQIENRTAFAHPMHLHGHPVRILSRNGKPPQSPIWRDTVLISPRERMEVAFVADNPGAWLLHCHIPEHMDAGMLGVVHVGA